MMLCVAFVPLLPLRGTIGRLKGRERSITSHLIAVEFKLIKFLKLGMFHFEKLVTKLSSR